jgi:TatD family-associated radical SAM protein
MSKPSRGSNGRLAYRGPNHAIYLNITNRCSSSCEYCFRFWAAGVFGVNLLLDTEPDLDDILATLELEFIDGPAPEVVFCGFGEPTMRLDEVLTVTEWLRLRRLRSRLNTNGHGSLLNPDVDVPASLATAGLNAVSVSLNAADPFVYDRISRPTFSKAHRAAIRFAEDCVQRRITTTISVVDHPDADVPGCEAIAARIGAGFRVRPLIEPPAACGGEAE